MKPGLFSDQVFLCSLRKGPVLLSLFYSEGAAATDSQQQLKTNEY